MRRFGAVLVRRGRTSVSHLRTLNPYHSRNFANLTTEQSPFFNLASSAAPKAKKLKVKSSPPPPISIPVTTVESTGQAPPPAETAIIPAIDQAIPPKSVKNKFDNGNVPFEDRVYRIDTTAKADAVLKILYHDTTKIWACDTEVDGIDLSEHGPVGNGFVTCISMYGGADVDFGEGMKNVLWIDNLGDNKGLLQKFKAWFEDSRFKKIWHNYGFDRHVMFNEGIDCMGFAGDTMHMARLWNTGRSKLSGDGSGYSLEALSSDLTSELFPESAKVGMKTLFGVSKVNVDGSDSKTKSLPPISELQTSPEVRDSWIIYSSRDAFATWHLYEVLSNKLRAMTWSVENETLGTMLDFYHEYWVPFGEVLTTMERNGILVDVNKLRIAQENAEQDKARMEKRFIDWAAKMCPDGKYINPSSTAQIQQLLFGKYVNQAQVEKEATFEVEKTVVQMEEDLVSVKDKNPYAGYSTAQLKEECKKLNLKATGTKVELITKLLGSPTVRFKGYTLSDLVDICNARNISSHGTKEELVERLNADTEYVEDMLEREQRNAAVTMPKKKFSFKIRSLGIAPIEFTPKGGAKASNAVLQKLAGKNLFGDEKDAVWGTAYNHFGGGAAGAAACQAIGALAQLGQIENTIQNFLIPLQKMADQNGRVHCSLNLNTDTGRLSSRTPNLQNQPALEKDQYKIRDSFCAAPENTLIVADYGQLELRLLAHMTNCKSMIDAFEKGGCFHSRTALGMYDHIKEAVAKGEVLLEWDYSKGKVPTVPLVKDKYGSERRKAKTLNFSIAYGKTVFGLAQDWGISKSEAEETLKAWYRDRPEVEKWQKATQEFAKKEKVVRTLMGRYRNLPDAATRGVAGNRSLRAAINTPIQGGAADVVVMAMIKISRSEELKKLNYKLLLQIHDEVILEGPKQHAEQALKEVKRCMESPFDGKGLKPLRVHLEVDAKCADTWYKAK